jgi:hypothetical protein
MVGEAEVEDDGLEEDPSVICRHGRDPGGSMAEAHAGGCSDRLDLTDHMCPLRVCSPQT